MWREKEGRMCRAGVGRREEEGEKRKKERRKRH